MYPDFDKTEVAQALEREENLKEQELKQLKKKIKVATDLEFTDAIANMKKHQLSVKTPSEID